MPEINKSQQAFVLFVKFVAMAVFYGLVMWIIDSFFASDHRYSFREIALQSVIFSILYNLYMLWSERKKKKKDSE